MKHLSIDVETFSTIDIKAGAYKYAEGMELLLLAYSYDYGPVKCIDLARGEKIPAQLEAAIFSPDVIKHAFNANFERVILGKYFGRYCEPEQWRCTLVRSAMGGYPLSLDQSAKALGLSAEKDMKGKALIKYFSMPCKPTKSNGQRTRNYPEHDLEKWSEFVEYCKQDVVVEQEVEKALYWVQISEQEHQNWVLNQKMNDRGWKVDLKLARNAVKLDAAFREELTKESKTISGLSNPNSVGQLKEWLSDAGVEVDSLNKDVLPGLIEEVFDEDVERMLQIRQEMSKTSVKKYSVMINSAGQDDRVRGLFQFYGASRTGREASRLVQVQNLPRNKHKGASLDAARELVLDGESDILDMCYGPTPDALSQLIRTAFIADKGKELAVTDFTAIEAVLVSYLAGEEWRLDVFKSHGKIYEASASKMFNIPIEQITKGSDLRQKGKVTELACIAENELVLTDKGLKPIQDVALSDKLWDGIEWVSHKGVIYKGEKKVINYGGLRATEDHLVWVKGAQRPVQFKHAAACGSHLTKTGDGRTEIRLGRDYISRKKMDERLAQTDGSYQMYGMCIYSMDLPRKSTKRKIKRLPTMFKTKTNTCVVGSKTYDSEATLRKPLGQRLSQLRGQRYPVQVPICDRSRAVFNKNFWAAGQIATIGSKRQRRSLRGREHTVRYQKRKLCQQTHNGVERMGPRRLALCSNTGNSNAISRDVQRTDFGKSKTCGKRETKKLEGNSRKVKVFDILDAGPRNRFTVSNVLVHNCSYGGGKGALIRMGALEGGIEEKELILLVRDWRKANSKIVKLWYDMSDAAKHTIRTGEKTSVGDKGVGFHMVHGNLAMRLPSGRYLYYINPTLEVKQKIVEKETPVYNEKGEHTHNNIEKKLINSETICFWGVDQTTRTWCKQYTHAAKLVENLVQGFARDCLFNGLQNLHKENIPVVASIHDEAVAEVPKGKYSIDEINSVFCKPADWMIGIPLKADGFLTDYYQKD